MSTPDSDIVTSVAPGPSAEKAHGDERPDALNSTIQLLALCPLLAVSDTVVKAVGFSGVVLILLPLATLLMGSIRRWVDERIVLPASLLITAGLVTAVELLMRAFFHDLGQSFGVFLPLLAVNIVVIDHIQAPDRSGAEAIGRSIRIAIGIALSLLALGFARELVGRGSLFNGASALLGSWAEQMELAVFSVDMGFLLAMLPPGAFISLGLLIAARNWLARRKQARA